MDRTEVFSVSDVLAKAGSNVHGNYSKAVLHQVPESETSVISVNPGEKIAPHLHTRTWDLFFVVSGSGEIRYKGKDDGAKNTVSILRERSALCRRATRTKFVM